MKHKEDEMEIIAADKRHLYSPHLDFMSWKSFLFCFHTFNCSGFHIKVIIVT